MQFRSDSRGRPILPRKQQTATKRFPGSRQILDRGNFYSFVVTDRNAVWAYRRSPTRPPRNILTGRAGYRTESFQVNLRSARARRPGINPPHYRNESGRPHRISLGKNRLCGGFPVLRNRYGAASPFPHVLSMWICSFKIG